MGGEEALGLNQRVAAKSMEILPVLDPANLELNCVPNG